MDDEKGLFRMARSGKLGMVLDSLEERLEAQEDAIRRHFGLTEAQARGMSGDELKALLRDWVLESELPRLGPTRKEDGNNVTSVRWKWRVRPMTEEEKAERDRGEPFGEEGT